MFILLLVTTTLFSNNPNILVYPMENDSATDEYSWLSSGFTHAITTDLNRLTGMNVISEQDRYLIMKEMKLQLSGLVNEDTQIEVGNLTGAHYIFSGSYTVVGNNIRVNCSLTDVKTGIIIKSVRLDGTLDNIFSLQDKIVLTLMEIIEESDPLPQIEESDPLSQITVPQFTDKDREIIVQETPTVNIDAFKWYSKARDIESTNPELALTYLDNAIEIDGEYIEALHIAGYIAADTFNDYDQALKYLNIAKKVQTANNKTQNSDYANLLMYFGIIYANQDNPDSALGYFDDALFLYEILRLKNTRSHASLVINTGVAYEMKEMPEIALEYFYSAKDLLNDLGFTRTIEYASLQNHIGSIFIDEGNFDMALDFLLKSENLYRDLGLFRTQNYGVLLKTMAYLFSEQNDYASALEYLQKALQLCENLELRTTTQFASLNMNIGNIFYKKGNFDMAMAHYTRSRDSYEILGLADTSAYAHLLYDIALVYHKLDFNSEAGKLFRQAYNIFASCQYNGERRISALENAKMLGF